MNRDSRETTEGDVRALTAIKRRASETVQSGLIGAQAPAGTLLSVPHGSGGPGLCPVSWRTVDRGTVRHVTGHSQGYS